MNYLISIPGSTFLIWFICLSSFAIFVARLLQNRDGTKLYHIPSNNVLNAMEMAVLRGGFKGVVHTALFKLWQDGTLEIRDKGKHARISVKTDPDVLKTFSAHSPLSIEHSLYQYIRNQPKQVCTPNSLFGAQLESHLQPTLQPIYKKLERLHLWRTDEMQYSQRKIPLFILGCILTIGLLKLGFGIYFGHPFSLLIFALFFITVASLILIFKQDKQSQLGHLYLKQRKKQLKSSTLMNDSDPLWRVAILGVAGVAGLAVFTEYESAFASTDTSGSMSVSHSSDSSDSGAGCGGCGGGGD